MSLLIISLIVATASVKVPFTSPVMNVASCLIAYNYRHLNFEKPMFFPFPFAGDRFKEIYVKRQKSIVFVVDIKCCR